MAHILTENNIQIGNLLVIYTKNKEIERYENTPRWSIQDFQQQPFTYKEITYFYFPFSVSNFSISSEIDGLNAEINISNTSWARDKINKDLSLIGAKINLDLIFLQKDGGADRGELPYDYSQNQPYINRKGIIDSIVYNNSIISFKIQSQISALDAVIPSETFTGEKFSNLPYRPAGNSNLIR